MKFGRIPLTDETLELLKNNFDELHNTRRVLRLAIEMQQQKSPMYSCYIVAGRPGWGKSHFILKMFGEYEKENDKVIKLHNLSTNIKGLYYSFRQQINPSPTIIGLDEGSELDSKNTMTRQSRKLEEAFVVMRETGHILLLSFYNPTKIQRFYKEDLIKGIFIVRQPFVAFYSPNQLDKIIKLLMKKKENFNITNFMKRKPRFVDYYNAYDGHLLSEYQKQKTSNIYDVIEKNYDALGGSIMTTGLTKAKFCREAGISPNHLQKLINEGIINCEKTPTGFFRIPIDEINNVPKQTRGRMNGVV